MNIRLSPLAIAAARVMRARGMTLAAIGARLAVHPSTIGAALAGRTHRARADEIRQHPERKTP